MKRFTSKNQRKGEFAEKITEKYLRNNDYKILERNYTKKYGELDLVTLKNSVLHFIEVKCVSCEIGKSGVIHETHAGVRPEENMHSRKIQRLHNTLQAYFLEHSEYACLPFQLDLACIYLDERQKKAKIELIENIIA